MIPWLDMFWDWVLEELDSMSVLRTIIRWIKSWPWLVLLSILSFVCHCYRNKDEQPAWVVSTSQVELRELLPGEYFVDVYYDAKKTETKFAIITQYSRYYNMKLTDEYGVTPVNITINKDGSIITDVLGTGTLAHNQDGDVMLTFRKGRYEWKLTTK